MSRRHFPGRRSVSRFAPHLHREDPMGTRTIKKAIDVDPPPERVWDVLLDDATYRQWTAEFMAGSYAETDWQEGSIVRFLDPSGSGLLAILGR
jgi:hypothetical protein